MSEDVWPKVGASFGLIAGVLLILTLVFGPTEAPPGFHDRVAEVQAYVRENHNEMQAAVALQFAALAAFLWFLGSVFYRLRAAESNVRISAAALAGGVALAAGGLMGSAAQGAAVYHVDVLDAGSVLALWDLSVFGYLFFLVGFTVLAAAAGVLAIRAKALPALLGAYTVLAAAYAFVVGVVASFSETGVFSPSDGALGEIAFLVFIVWLLAMGATLVIEPRGRTSGAATQPQVPSA